MDSDKLSAENCWVEIPGYRFLFNTKTEEVKSKPWSYKMGNLTRKSDGVIIRPFYPRGSNVKRYRLQRNGAAKRYSVMTVEKIRQLIIHHNAGIPYELESDVSSSGQVAPHGVAVPFANGSVIPKMEMDQGI